MSNDALDSPTFSVSGLRVPRYRLHRASDQAVVTICGRDTYLGAHGSPESRAEYERVIGEFIASRGVPEDRRANLTIDEFSASSTGATRRATARTRRRTAASSRRCAGSARSSARCASPTSVR